MEGGDATTVAGMDADVGTAGWRGDPVSFIPSWMELARVLHNENTNSLHEGRSMELNTYNSKAAKGSTVFSK